MVYILRKEVFDLKTSYLYKNGIGQLNNNMNYNCSNIQDKPKLYKIILYKGEEKYHINVIIWQTASSFKQPSVTPHCQPIINASDCQIV